MPPTGRKRRTAAHCTEPCCEPACFDASECCDDPACTKPDKCPEEACCGNSCGPRPRLERRGRAGASLVTAACLACVAVLAMAPTRVAASGGGDLRPGFVVCDAEGNCEFSPELLHEYCNEREVDDFNMGLHVGAIFIQVGFAARIAYQRGLTGKHRLA